MHLAEGVERERERPPPHSRPRPQSPILLSSSVTNRLIVEREKVILIDDDYLCYNSSSMLQRNRV